MDTHVTRNMLSLPLAIMSCLAVGANDTSRPRELPEMDCRLVVENKSHSSAEEFVGIFELRNISLTPITMKYKCHRLFQPLDLDVWDMKGNLLPKSILFYGHLFSPMSPTPFVRTFAAGEMDSGQVVLFAQVDKELRPITPGTYTVQAVYRWKGQAIRSNKVKVEVLAK